jgi:predicted transcriptional regulator YheO
MKQNNETDIRLDTLEQLVSVVAKAISPACEVLLHDLRDLDSSTIAVSGDVTGRKVGAPMTDLGLRILRRGKQSSHLINYSSKSSDGRSLRSSTFIIRNSKGKPIAFVCINFNLTTAHLLQDLINSSFLVDLPSGDVILDEETKETYTTDVREILKLTVADVLRKSDRPVSIMNKRDRLKVVEMLDEAGIFAIKNSHSYVATVLNTSRYTIYNYLNEIKHRS